MERVRIDGVFLDTLGPARELKDSTIVRRDGWSGDYQASCRFDPRSGALPSWVRRGALYEHVGISGRTWGGLLSEPTRADDGSWSLNANGFGSAGDDYLALSGSTPEFIPDDAVDAAISDGLPWSRPVSLDTTAVTSLADKLPTITSLLLASAKETGAFVYVDSFGAASYAVAAATAQWTTVPTPGYGGTADQNYASHLYGWYVSSVDGTTGEPDGWDTVLAGPASLRAEAQAQSGRKSDPLDLTDRGLLTSGEAQAIVDAVYAASGARMSYTVPFDLRSFNLRRLGFGKANPMSMYGTNGAGTMLQVPGSMDARSQPTVLGSWRVPLGEVTRIHDDEQVQATPLGFEARDFTPTIEAAVWDAKRSRRRVGELAP